MNTISPAQQRRLTAAVRAQIKHYERCGKLLLRVDAEVLAAGRDLFKEESGLVLWLCEPAHSLGGKLPLHVMRTAAGRKLVAGILRSIAYGNYL
jgi:uncharacterized protein (DUF2384 family)